MSNRFDTVINMFSSFGYLESEQDDQQVLHQIHKVLKPGGKLLMDLLNREWVIINNEEFDWHQHQDGRIVLERRQLDLATSTNHLTYTEILPDGTRNQLSNLKMRLYTLTELTKMLTTANLTLQNTYGGFQTETLHTKHPPHDRHSPKNHLIQNPRHSRKSGNPRVDWKREGRTVGAGLRPARPLRRRRKGARCEASGGCPPWREPPNNYNSKRRQHLHSFHP